MLVMLLSSSCTGLTFLLVEQLEIAKNVGTRKSLRRDSNFKLFFVEYFI